jgi:hypothetical protein
MVVLGMAVDPPEGTLPTSSSGALRDTSVAFDKLHNLNILKIQTSVASETKRELAASLSAAVSFIVRIHIPYCQCGMLRGRTQVQLHLLASQRRR